MDQSDLRRLEKQCVQEEVPWCVAACPLHVDVKQFCALMGQGLMDKAWSVLAKTLPLPGVLARLCDGPCRSACIRKDAGGAIAVDALERACAGSAKPVNPPKPLPSRHKSVGVVGGGLTGLCAAWEMVRRGFAVTLYCERAGSGLLEIGEAVLPQGVLAQELQSLSAMGVKLEEGVTLNPALVDSLLEEMDAVFLDTGDAPESLCGYGEPDTVTLGTQRPGLFVGPATEPSAILQAAAGRRAANSIERYTQGVSMVSGRELEGPYETRLFTSLEKVESVPPVFSGINPTEAEAQSEAGRCLQCECKECVKTCEYLKHYKYYPKIYARQIYNNESIVMGTRQANTMINSCMLCGLCETVCPEDFPMGDVCLEARRSMVERGKMPPSAHEFALRDMAFANGERCALARHAPGASSSEYVFFPGCQLTASSPGGVERAYADLRERLGNVGLMLNCCGAPAMWSGRTALFAQSMEALRSEWEALGSPKLIIACPTCLKTLRPELPDAEMVSHWSVLRALGVAQQAGRGGGRLTINDPCAARHDPILREDVRAVCEQVGATLEEPELTGEYTACCGFGGLLSEANPKLGLQAARKRAQAGEADFVTYCVMCRDMLAKVGKRAMHCYDLLYPTGGEPAARPSPGYSERRENRVRLRERLLRDLWKDFVEFDKEAHEAIQVALTEQAVATLEERRILVSDVQKVLLQARTTGKRFQSGDTGRFLASYRPVVVTYWVEYEEVGDTFLVHNAWSHRMRIIGGRS